ncbi:nuclear transport factor 2 family protein [Nocardioides ferulae]|uniref:nuclear transport factor 2 family protein n=1 Tax=Nocardioides ferulae TaxID=2340821 RepID=UPI000EAD9F82|nr:nuclear transport factor 2 family protein [Nocardioides ferulae]
MTTQPTETDPFTAFRAAVESRDMAGAASLFAEDATFWSPVVHQPYVGRDAIALILSGVAQVFEDFRYTASYADDSGDDGTEGHVLAFTTRVGDRELQGVDILRSSGGRLTELTVMVRPYSAATALRERMAALLA